jgi:hypothetical protein
LAGLAVAVLAIVPIVRRRRARAACEPAILEPVSIRSKQS